MAHIETSPDEENGKTSTKFLDLPAEIRNQIYQNALTFESRQYYGSRTCSVALLATCKQVQKEAQDLLFAENEVVIRLATAANSKSVINLTANGKDINFSQANGKLEIQWPNYLKRIGKIRIGCSFNHRESSAWRTSMIYIINNILYDLNYLLLDNPHLGTIRIDVTNNARAVASDFSEMLSPLRLFGERAQLDFQGLPWPMTQRLLMDSTEPDPYGHINVFAAYRKLQRESFACLSLCVETMPLPKSVLIAREIHLRIEEKHLPSMEKMMTVHTDRNLKRHLCDLDRALSSIDFDAIEAAPKMLKEPGSWYQESLTRLRNRQMVTSGVSQPDKRSA